jgi:hypothetical protein
MHERYFRVFLRGQRATFSISLQLSVLFSGFVSAFLPLLVYQLAGKKIMQEWIFGVQGKTKRENSVSV